MTEIQFGKLEDLPLRDAWKHEAHEFTPWLAENIDHLSEAIGIPLELTGTEVAVESFSADILARNPIDDTVVLIENQLETTDHTHLGQIMTYLAGLEAQAVVWIAPSFRQPHISAIRWLNEHTADGFSFFAVKARVVRIGDSPFAPIFEVVEKPDGWGRSLKNKAVAAASPSYQAKERFWIELASNYPEMIEEGFSPGRVSNSWITLLEDPRIVVSLYLAQKNCGLFLRGKAGANAQEVYAFLEPHREELEAGIGAALEPNDAGRFMWSYIDRGYRNESDWPDIQRWMVEKYQTYKSTVTRVFSHKAG